MIIGMINVYGIMSWNISTTVWIELIDDYDNDLIDDHDKINI